MLASTFTSQWTVLLVVLAVLLALTEIGFRLGVRLHEKKDAARKEQIGGIQGAILGMFGLLLGFTFAMAENRYEARRDLVLQEANAIGSTFFGASLLPGAHQAPVENLLRHYVDARLAFYAAGNDASKIAAAESAAAVIQRDLWAQATAAAKEAPNAITATFVESLSGTIDLDATRLNALRTRVPGAVWVLVLAVAGCGVGVSGYGAGATGARGRFWQHRAAAAHCDRHHPRRRPR